MVDWLNILSGVAGLCAFFGFLYELATKQRKWATFIFLALFCGGVGFFALNHREGETDRQPRTDGGQKPPVAQKDSGLTHPTQKTTGSLVHKVVPSAETSPNVDSISGEWEAYNWQPKIRVSIRQTGKDVVATTITPNGAIPSRQIEFYGPFDANPFAGRQICSGANFTNPFWVKVRLQVIDTDHISEELVEGNCTGFPVQWIRASD